MDGTTSPRKTRADNSHQVASPHPSYPSVNARMSSAIPDAMAAALDPMAAALMARRNLEDAQARLLMQQHYQAGDALVAAAMARASSNLMARGQFPLVNQDALLYQRALLERQAGIGSLGFVAPPDQTRLAQNLAAADARSKDALSDEPSPEIDSAESKSSENDVDSDDEAASKGENEEDEDDFKTEDQNSKHRPYFDRSLLPDPPSGEESSEEDGISKLPNAPSKKPIEPFPEKLYRIIEEAKENGQENIISFFPHGRAVGIHKPKMFIDEIMPKYFATHRMASFHRQLNLYGFRRIAEGRDKGGFYHEYFLEGRKGLVKKIKRKRPKVPISKGDLAMADNISKSKAPTENDGMDSAMPSNPSLQHMLMMDRAGLLPSQPWLGMGIGISPYGSFTGPTPPVRGQIPPSMGALGADNVILNGLGPFGAQPYSYMGSAPP